MTSIRRFRSVFMLCLGILFLTQTLAYASEQDQINQADQLTNEHKYNEALAILTPLISSPEPTAYDAKGALVRCYQSAKQWDKAISTLESCIQEYPDNSALWQARLGRCYREMGDNTKAIVAFKNGLDSTSRTPIITQALTEFLWQCYAEKNDWDAAVSYYQSLLVKSPEDAVDSASSPQAEWHYQLGRCYWNMGKGPEAIAELEKAIELAKDLDIAKRVAPVLFSYYHASKEYEKEEALFKKLNQEYPSGSAYWASCRATMLLSRGTHLQDSGKSAEAIPFMQEVIDRFGLIPECRDSVEIAYVCIPECMCAIGKSDEAKAYVKKFYDDRPDMRGAALYAQGMVSFLSKNYDDAITAFRQMFSDYPNFKFAPVAHPYLAAALQGAGWTDESVEVFRALLAGEADPERKASVLFNIANIYMEAKRFSDAIGVLNQLHNSAGLLDETQARAAYTLAYCYLKTGLRNTAENVMREVIARYPESDAAKLAKMTLDSWSVEDK